MLGKYLLCPAIVEVRISRESMDEVQYLVTLPTTRLIPNPVSQHRGSDNETDCGEDAQLPCSHERPSRHQKQRSRYREPYLVCKCGNEEGGIAMLQSKLKSGIH